jgi:DNA repair exonuclease SbcCD ATPase subunit
MMAGEDEYKKVLEEIGKLESMIPDGIFSSEKPDWKSVWGQIRVVGASFKAVKFPTHDEHQEAWEHFQRIVAHVKESQAEEHQQWEEKKRESSRYKDEIVHQAELAKPSGPMDDLVLSIATGGLSTALSALMGPFDEIKDELMSCSEHLKQGWALLNEHKENMLGQDKKEAYNALYQAQEQLNQAWVDYKRERQQAFDDSHTERQRKHDEWVTRIEANIDKLEDRRANLLERIAHREDILNSLREKLDNAWSDDYHDNISGWIDEEEGKLDALRSKLENVENWIEEARSRLNS